MTIGRWCGAAWILAWLGVVGCSVGGSDTQITTAFEPTASNGNTSTGSEGTADDDPPPMTSNASADGTTSAPPDDSCCQVAPTPGCGNEEIQACVCTLDPSCCMSVWSEDCVAMAIDPCGDPACEGPPGTSTMPPGDSSSGGMPTQTCEQVAMDQGWMYFRCQQGDIACNDMGTPTTDCEYCCEFCGEPGAVSCGDHATKQGWGAANCEWNGNGACGGTGMPTCDCDYCCEVS